MGNNRKNENNGQEDNSKPPPYEEINTDEFGVGKSISPSAPLATIHSTSAIQNLASTGSHQTKNAGDGENTEKGFEKFSEHTERPITGNITPNSFTPAPSAFSVTQSSQSEVTMSASQFNPNLPIVQHTSFITDSYMPRHSVRMVCPNCKASVNSAIQYTSGQLTHLVALVACWFTCCLACVPYFIDDLKDAEHFCPQCRAVLGYNRKKVLS